MGGEILHLLVSKFFRNTFDIVQHAPAPPVNRGWADLGRLRRVTARPIDFDSIGVTEKLCSLGFGLILDGLEVEFLDFLQVLEKLLGA